MQDHLLVFSEYIQNELTFTSRRSFSLLKLYRREWTDGSGAQYEIS